MPLWNRRFESYSESHRRLVQRLVQSADNRQKEVQLFHRRPITYGGYGVMVACKIVALEEWVQFPLVTPTWRIRIMGVHLSYKEKEVVRFHYPLPKIIMCYTKYKEKHKNMDP